MRGGTESACINMHMLNIDRSIDRSVENASFFRAWNFRLCVFIIPDALEEEIVYYEVIIIVETILISSEIWYPVMRLLKKSKSLKIRNVF